LVRGEHVKDEELQSLVLEAKQQAALPAAGEPPRADRARLEEEWHRIERLVQSLGSMPSQGPQAPRAQLRQVSETVPEQLRPRVEQHLQALLRGERGEREELRSILSETRQLTDREPRAGRARLDAEWQRVQALGQPPMPPIRQGRGGKRRGEGSRKTR
jgi:hypothetical protein